MAFPLAPLAIGFGAAVAGKVFRGKPAEPRDFATWMRDFRRDFGPERYGLSTEQYDEALSGGRENITRERDIGTTRGLTALKNAGLGRSAAAGTVSLRSASASEQAYGKLLSQLSALDAQVGEQQRQTVINQGIASFEAQGREDSRVASQNQMAEQQFGNYLQMFVDPIENFYLMRDLKSIRALSFQPSAFSNQPTTEELFNTEDASGRFDLDLGRAWRNR